MRRLLVSDWFWIGVGAVITIGYIAAVFVFEVLL